MHSLRHFPQSSPKQAAKVVAEYSNIWMSHQLLQQADNLTASQRGRGEAEVESTARLVQWSDPAVQGHLLFSP